MRKLSIDSNINKQEIDVYYNKFSKKLFGISCTSIPLSNQSCKAYVTSLFTYYVKEFYTTRRDAYAIWQVGAIFLTISTISKL